MVELAGMAQMDVVAVRAVMAVRLCRQHCAATDRHAVPYALLIALRSSCPWAVANTAKLTIVMMIRK